MKKLSHRDWAIAGIIAILSCIITWAVCSMYYHNNPVMIESPANVALKSQNDSLKGVIVMKEAQVKEHEKNDAKSDSILFYNSKLFKKDYDKIESMSDSVRLRYVDSVLKRAGVRR